MLSDWFTARFRIAFYRPLMVYIFMYFPFNCSFLESMIFPGINQVRYFIQRFYAMSSCSSGKYPHFSYIIWFLQSPGSRQILFIYSLRILLKKTVHGSLFHARHSDNVNLLKKIASERAYTYVLNSCQR